MRLCKLKACCQWQAASAATATSLTFPGRFNEAHAVPASTERSAGLLTLFDA